MHVNNCMQHHDLVHAFQDALAENSSLLLRRSHGNNPGHDFALSVVKGLAKIPRQLDCRFLYDAHGSELYEKICRQPEYYPTRTEASILRRFAKEIRRITGPVTLIELGSGSSVKTDHLLAAYLEKDPSACYVPIDVSETALQQAGHAITAQRPNVQFIGIHGTYHDGFPLVNCATPAMVIFLGSTIGNFTEQDTGIFLQWLWDHLAPDDYFLLGIDLVKDTHLLEAAYNDGAGVTASFTENYFARMNRELKSGIDMDAVAHYAFFNEKKSQVEIYGHFNRPQTIHVAKFNKNFAVERDEKILVEISRKFKLNEFIPYLESLGYALRRGFTDEKKWFALLLLQKSDTLVRINDRKNSRQYRPKES